MVSITNNPDYCSVGKTLDSMLNFLSKVQSNVILKEPIFLNGGSPTKPVKGGILLPKGELTSESLSKVKDAGYGNPNLEEFLYSIKIFSNLTFKETYLVNCLCNDAKIFIENAPYGFVDVKGVDKGLDEIIANFEFDLLTLTDLHVLRSSVPSIYSKAIQTSVISMKIAKDLGFDNYNLRILGTSALLANISLAKYGLFELMDLDERKVLLEKDREVFLYHGAKSAKILEKRGFDNKIINTVFYHHEDYDNKRDALPLFSQVIRVVESYVSMVSSSYKEKKQIPLALAELQTSSGKEFSPVMVGVISSYFRECNVSGELKTDEKSKLIDSFFKFINSLNKEESLLMNMSCEGHSSEIYVHGKKELIKIVYNKMRGSFTDNLVKKYQRIAHVDIVHDIRNSLMVYSLVDIFDEKYESPVSKIKEVYNHFNKVFNHSDTDDKCLSEKIRDLVNSARITTDLRTKAKMGLEIESEVSKVMPHLERMFSLSKELEGLVISDGNFFNGEHIKFFVKGLSNAYIQSNFYTQSLNDINFGIMADKVLSRVMRLPEYEGRNITIKKHIEHVNIRMNADILNSVLENIYHNSIDSIAVNGGDLYLDIRKDDFYKCCVLSVGNKGVISEQVLRSIKRANPAINNNLNNDGRGICLINSLNLLEYSGASLTWHVDKKKNSGYFEMILPYKVKN